MVTEEKTDTATARGVRIDVDGNIGYIRLNKPKLNLYDRQFIAELNEAIDEVRFNSDIKVVIMVSELEKVFSAGADIHMLKASQPDFKSSFCLGAQETLSKMERTPKLFLAVLHGHTVGGGLEIALATDIRFASDNPGMQIGLPEVKLGVLPGTGGTQRLSRLIGKSRALDLMITGRLLSPQEALDYGIVNYLYPAEELLSRVEEYAHNLLAGATRAIGLIKQAVVQGTEVHLDAGFFMERELQNRLFITEDAQEGLASFIEKRQPEFKGR
ncbi:MAG TPA: enoyl-CoA hydratase/isomerase family protein [Chloroflexota bacterium]|nr:enoyl-CoA hydratase/isomerase family protein [Chloroflexota bacterium]